ncbi:vWA domain-containing protein [Pulveribacter sp.]|uniref:vWA domain-containing protein n=1 Tax=Pulveribacter sp. TaxID=2678893 RepID=UPI0028AAB273|nr:VWA domain-containing protein [Pulveribacter sp.]
MLDCSASMRTSGQLARAKGAVHLLMQQAGRWRDQVALVVLDGTGAHLALAPQRALAQGFAGALAPLPGGGGTPLAAALQLADGVLARHSRGARWLWLLTDGRTRASPPRPAHAQQLHVIDFETARPPLGRAQALAALWQAGYWPARALWQ